MVLKCSSSPGSMPKVAAANSFVSELDGDPDIFTMDGSGQNQARITNNDSADTHPRW